MGRGARGLRAHDGGGAVSVTTGERYWATGATRTCPKCQGKRLTLQFETVHPRDDTLWPNKQRTYRDRFQCLDCWHVWYEEVK